jgi:hypothetical protein
MFCPPLSLLATLQSAPTVGSTRRLCRGGYLRPTAVTEGDRTSLALRRLLSPIAEWACLRTGRPWARSCPDQPAMRSVNPGALRSACGAFEAELARRGLRYSAAPSPGRCVVWVHGTRLVVSATAAPDRDFVYVWNARHRDLIGRLGGAVTREHAHAPLPLPAEVFEVGDSIRAIGSCQG